MFIWRRALKTFERDVFICHASEDKEKIVRNLVLEFDKASISYWYDEAEIKWGDSILEKVNSGLGKSKYIIIILSDNFISKKWPQKELNAALNMEASSGVIKVLPVIVGTKDNIFQKFPLLHDKSFISWNNNPSEIALSLKVRLLSSDDAIAVKANNVDSPNQYFVYGEDYNAIKKASQTLSEYVIEKPKSSPLGPFFIIESKEQTHSKLKLPNGVSIYNYPRHEMPEKKFIYIVKGDDILSAQEIIGDFNNHPNWEVCSLGMCVEASITPSEISKIEQLESVSIFSEPQHLVTKEEAYINQIMDWSQGGEKLTNKTKNLGTIEEIAEAISEEFQNICLVEFTSTSINMTELDSELTIFITMNYEEGDEPNHGEMTGHLESLLVEMKKIVGTKKNMNKNKICLNHSIFDCIGGILFKISFSW